jgi:L-rhamnose mutarotase
MKRYGMVIGLVPEKVEEYKRLHAAAWPDVLRMISECHIQNYTIYLRTLEDGLPYLFSHFEYLGNDFTGDMARMAADPTTQRWWACCEPCQRPLANRKQGEWWASMEEVFHWD